MRHVSFEWKYTTYWRIDVLSHANQRSIEWSDGHFGRQQAGKYGSVKIPWKFSRKKSIDCFWKCDSARRKGTSGKQPNSDLLPNPLNFASGIFNISLDHFDFNRMGHFYVHDKPFKHLWCYTFCLSSHLHTSTTAVSANVHCIHFQTSHMHTYTVLTGRVASAQAMPRLKHRPMPNACTFNRAWKQSAQIALFRFFPCSYLIKELIHIRQSSITRNFLSKFLAPELIEMIYRSMAASNSWLRAFASERIRVQLSLWHLI